jgi:hypothetical protein
MNVSLNTEAIYVKTTKAKFWSHPSVIPFTKGNNPISAIVGLANDCVIDAMEKGWQGPPFDTFELAHLLGFELIPRESIRDARLIPLPRGRYRIEYNPNRPRARIRFSIAHEIGHTFFPDCNERIRNRTAKHHMVENDWQLEMLCNIAASELLMPMASFPEIDGSKFSIDSLLHLREKYQVSTEAVLLRFIRLAKKPCAIFCASYQSIDSEKLSIDYIQLANNWSLPFTAGFEIPLNSVVYQCGAIGYTAKQKEKWDTNIDQLNVECVAIPSYPGADNPRVVGLLSPKKSNIAPRSTINYLIGDANEPRGDGNKIIAHIVNDKTPRWGGGFAKVLKKKWPRIQSDFIEWSAKGKSNFHLGNHHSFQLNDEITIYHMIAQHGYGHSNQPRIRYHALEKCLNELLILAYQENSTVHMPRIGCGQAGGSWAIVSGLIDNILCRNGVDVTIYDLPSEREKWLQPDRQRTLFDDFDVI